MLYSGSITIPANTTKDSPTTVTLEIARGIITKYMVRPRPGHAALAHLVIRFHEHQVAPSHEDSDLHGDALPIDWEEFYEVKGLPYELKLEGWNDDDTYPHTFDVFVAVLPPRAVLALAVVDAFKSLLSLVLPRPLRPKVS